MKNRRTNTRTDWRADLQRIRNSRSRADAAAQKAAERAQRLAAQQEEAENMGILHVVRGMQMTPEQLDDLLHGRTMETDALPVNEPKEEKADEQENEAQE
ncbi:MAG: DUF4315 family protein [Aristaeellaceae bacterium]